MKTLDPNQTVSVLLIEDDVVDEMAMLRTVTREGLPYRMQVARTAAQARKLLAEREFDIILADYQLPDGSAFDLMDAFGEHLVIFVTGAWNEADAARALRLGVHDYVIKDDEGKYLQLMNYRVQTALRQRRMTRALRDGEARLQAILDHAPASISACDLQGKLILSNRQHHELAALRASSVGVSDTAVGMLPAMLTPAQAAALALAHQHEHQHDHANTNAHAHATAPDNEETLTHADGTEHSYHTVHFPMPDADGQPQAMGTISVDITARKQAEQQIRNLAFFDPLTGLPNRRLLIDRLKQAFAASARHANHGAVFFIDLDHFKILNDTLGHDHGDMLLVEVARRLQACVRGEDTVARIGGDEFVVMAVGLSEDARAAASQASLVGEKILSAVRMPCVLGQHLHTVTPSIGLSLFKGQDHTLDDVLKRADLAMYQAKAEGRGTLRFFDPVMQSALDTRAALESDMRLALDAGQLGLHFQGLIDGQRGTVGAEALLRWMHPTLGLLLPSQFVPLAEQSGLIVPIGEWVIESACAQLERWAADPRWQHLQLAVNVSPRQFRQAGFSQTVEAAMQRHHVVPGRLRLELREGLAQAHADQTLVCMTALCAAGVAFTIEDFGIGASSLQLLKRLPLDQIKIARSLLEGLTTSRHDQAIVKTIIGIGRELGLSVLASGVETQQQRHSLADLGCSLWQGYLFGQPVPVAEFESGLAPIAQAVDNA